MALAIPCRIFFLLIILHQFCLFFFSFLFINIFHSFSLLFLLHLSFSSFRQWSRQKVRPFFRHCLSENMATKPTFFFKNQIQSAISSQNMPFLAFLDAALIVYISPCLSFSPEFSCFVNRSSFCVYFESYFPHNTLSVWSFSLLSHPFPKTIRF